MKTVDYIVLILVVHVSLVVIMSTLVPVFTGKIISENKAALLAELLDQFMAVIFFYVGYKLREREEKNGGL